MAGCVTHQTLKGSRVRAMTEFDIPRCKFIVNVEAGGHWYSPFPYIPDADIEDSFNDLMNAVASVGGDAYVLRNPEGRIYHAEAWICNWKNGRFRELTRSGIEPKEISAEKRTECNFLETFTQASYWGMTHKRNKGKMMADAINEVKEIGGDAYFLAHTVIRDGGMHVLVAEAYLCGPDENIR